jgi:spore germination protein
MIIHVVQQGETINSIADHYGMSVEQLLQDNNLPNPGNLVVGQSIVIAPPEQTYTVQEGDTLEEIATVYNVSVMQLLRNNPFLSDREYIYPGETLVIRYNNTKGSVTVHGNSFPFINIDILKKTLPYLTYLSVVNYTATTEGEIMSSYDDTLIIQLAKDYKVLPLMLLSTFTLIGEANLRVAYDLLINKDFQNKQIDNILNILRTKGYRGVNLSFQYVNASTLSYYESYLENVFNRLNEEGYSVFATVTPDFSVVDQVVNFDLVDYSIMNQYANSIIFMNYEWATILSAPSPITSISSAQVFLDYIKNSVSLDKVVIGIPTIGYDWQLPFLAGVSEVTSLTMNNAITLASVVDTEIQFDEVSQTPYYFYSVNINNSQRQHVVWFIDARSIKALAELVSTNNLLGSGVWNIMEFNSQLWLIFNTQYEIVKIEE